jgi:hypothetical protein
MNNEPSRRTVAGFAAVEGSGCYDNGAGNGSAGTNIFMIAAVGGEFTCEGEKTSESGW